MFLRKILATEVKPNTKLAWGIENHELPISIPFAFTLKKGNLIALVLQGRFFRSRLAAWHFPPKLIIVWRLSTLSYGAFSLGPFFVPSC